MNDVRNLWFGCGLVLMLLAISSLASCRSSEQIQVRHGIMRVNSESMTSPKWTYEIVEVDTVSRERLVRGGEDDTGERIGFIVEMPDPSEKFSLYSVHHLPGIPMKLGKGFSEYEPQDAVNGLRTKTREFFGSAYRPFRVNPGDPLGTWKIEVFVNNRLEKTIEFEMIE